jgi:hypothetical protein
MPVIPIVTRSSVTNRGAIPGFPFIPNHLEQHHLESQPLNFPSLSVNYL